MNFSSSHVKVEIWRSTAAALLCCDDSVNKWFSTFLEKDNLLLACGLDSTGNLISPRNPHSEGLLYTFKNQKIDELRLLDNIEARGCLIIAKFSEGL